MRRFLFEDKPYRINPYFRRQRKETDSALVLARLLKKLAGHSQKNQSKPKFYGSGSIRRDIRQKCTVKMQYSNSKEAHKFQLEKYLVLEGKGIDGSKPELYGTDLEEYRNNMVDKNFRIFLSPQSDKIDLTDLTKKFVKTLELQTGYTLYWQGANHYDTAHPHAHLLINGKDKSGKEVEFPRDVVKTFMREYARDICTAQVGNRTREEIALEKEKQLEAKRYTRLDETIKEMCGGTFSLDPANIKTDRERILCRLENLRKMNMCTYSDGVYKLSNGWEENLKANGRYNTFLQARSELAYSNPASLKVFSGEHGTVTGKVTKVYRTDGDASDNHAVIIECFDGNAYFVPLFKQPQVNTGKEKTVFKDGQMATVKEKANLSQGELVSIKTYESQRGRLTPVIFRREAKEVQKYIAKTNIKGLLAAEVSKAKTGGWNENRK